MYVNRWVLRLYLDHHGTINTSPCLRHLLTILPIALRQEYASRHNSIARTIEGSVSSKGDDVDHAEKADL
jgi:hypothetical protein